MALNPITAWIVREFKRAYERSKEQNNDRIRNLLAKILGQDELEQAVEERRDLLQAVGIGLFRRVCGGDAEFRDILCDAVDWQMLMEYLSSNRQSFGID
jgi:hypothetical protein